MVAKKEKETHIYPCVILQSQINEVCIFFKIYPNTLFFDQIRLFVDNAYTSLNNAGSSRRLCNYLEHEDMERMEQRIYTEGFFNLNEDNLYKSQLVKDIDNNKAQLLKTDAKFYAIHVSPSEQELRAVGSTE